MAKSTSILGKKRDSSKIRPSGEGPVSLSQKSFKLRNPMADQKLYPNGAGIAGDEGIYQFGGGVKVLDQKVVDGKKMYLVEGDTIQAQGGANPNKSKLFELHQSKQNEKYKIYPQKEWLENWMNDPEFQKRLQSNLEEINKNKSFLLRDIPYSFPFTFGSEYWKNKSNEEKEKALKRLTTVKDFYTEGYNKNEKLIDDYYKAIFPNNPEQAANYALEDRVISKGSYLPSTHSLIINSYLAGKSTPVHEYTHSTGLDYLLKPLIPQAKKVTDEYKRLEKENPGFKITYDLFGNPILSNYESKGFFEKTKYIPNDSLNFKVNPSDIKYLNKSEEIYPRIMQLRYENNIKPGEIIDKKKFEKIKKASQDNYIFDLYNDDEIIKLLNKLAQVEENKDVKNLTKEGGVIKDNRGQWEHPGEVTQIDSPYITMQGVPYPVVGVSDEGDVKLMLPNRNYFFEGNSVTEYPMMQKGGSVPTLYVSDPNDPRLKAYQDSSALYKNWLEKYNSLVKKAKEEENKGNKVYVKTTHPKGYSENEQCTDIAIASGKCAPLANSNLYNFTPPSNPQDSQYISSYIKPSGFNNFLIDNLLFDRSIGKIYDFSNVKPKQEVRLKEQEKIKPVTKSKSTTKVEQKSTSKVKPSVKEEVKKIVEENAPVTPQAISEGLGKPTTEYSEKEAAAYRKKETETYLQPKGLTKVESSKSKVELPKGKSQGDYIINTQNSIYRVPNKAMFDAITRLGYPSRSYTTDATKTGGATFNMSDETLKSYLKDYFGALEKIGDAKTGVKKKVGGKIKAQQGVLIRNADGTVSSYNPEGQEYRKLYESGQIGAYDEATNSFYPSGTLPEVTITAQRPKSFQDFFRRYNEQISKDNQDTYNPVGPVLQSIYQLPQAAVTYALDPKSNVLPGKALGIDEEKHPYWSMLVNGVADPVNLFGVGLADDATKLISKIPLRRLLSKKLPTSTDYITGSYRPDYVQDILSQTTRPTSVRLSSTPEELRSIPQETINEFRNLLTRSSQRELSLPPPPSDIDPFGVQIRNLPQNITRNFNLQKYKNLNLAELTIENPSLANKIKQLLRKNYETAKTALAKTNIKAGQYVDEKFYPNLNFNKVIEIANENLKKGMGVAKQNADIQLRPMGGQYVDVFIDNVNTGHINLPTTKRQRSLLDILSGISVQRDPFKKAKVTGLRKAGDFPFGRLPIEEAEKLKKLGISGEINKAISESLKSMGSRLYSGATGHTTEGFERYKNLLNKGYVEEIAPQIFMYKKLGGTVKVLKVKAQDGKPGKPSSYNSYYVPIQGSAPTENTGTKIFFENKNITPYESAQLKKAKEQEVINKQINKQIEKQEIENRKARIADSEKANQELKNGAPLTAERLARLSQATGDKLRFSNEPNFFDDWVNPLSMVGSMASGLGQIPQNINRGNYGQAAFNLALPLGVGALGSIGAKSTGQFINNLVNPFAGTGEMLKRRVNKTLSNYGKEAFTPTLEGLETAFGKYPKSSVEVAPATVDISKNLADLQAAKDFAKLYGYELPENLERIAQSNKLTDMTIRGLMDRHNTFVRGVSTNWNELQKRLISKHGADKGKDLWNGIVQNFEAQGIDYINNPKAAAEYMATHIPISTGYGRASLDKEVFKQGLEGLYTSNSIPTAEGYTYGQGYIIKVKKPTDFSSSNRLDWITKNNPEYNIGVLPSSRKFNVNELAKTYYSDIDLALKEGRINDTEHKLIYDYLDKYNNLKKQLLKKHNITEDTPIFSKQYDDYFEELNKERNILAEHAFDIKLDKSILKTEHNKKTGYAHYIHLGTPGEKVLQPIKSWEITPEIWKNKSRAHTNKYSKKLSAMNDGGTVKVLKEKTVNGKKQYLIDDGK